MTTPLSRREALRHIGSTGAWLALAPAAVRWQGAGLEIAGRPVQVVAAAVGPTTLRLGVLPLAGGPPQAVAGDGSLVEEDWAPVRQRVVGPGAGAVRVGELLVEVRDGPFSVRVESSDGNVVQDLGIDRDSGAVSFELGDRPLLGMGQGGPQFDRRGHTYRMRSGQGGYQLRTHGGVVPLQWLIGTGGWAMLIHRPYGTFDLTGERGLFTPKEGEAALPFDAFVISERDPVRVMAEYARLTGYPELPPLWAFGYLQSHRTLSGPEEVRWVARTFRDKRLPCDALIYLGTGFTPSGWNTLNGEFNWNRDVFPDPEAMITELHDLHYKVVVHVVLEGRRLTGTVHDPCPEAPGPGATGAGRDWPDEQQVACYWPIHREVLEQGVDGWWPDQGDGLDAPSRLTRNRMYWEGTQMLRPGERVFALHRNGHAGMQRYAAFLWSGDVYTTWETLRTHVSVAINTGLSGIPYWGTDIGGFVPTAEYTGELHVRWFQFGAFCPLFRSHGRTWHLRLPWGWNTGELGHDEIASYRGGAANPDPSDLNNPDVEPICKQYLELRYRLLPYTYTAVREGHDTGLPILRALWLHYPDDTAAVGRGDQYLWGRDILVAPVTEPGATSRRLYLPAGDWYDFWTEELVAGGREIDRPVDLATLPLYVRAGAVLPMGPIKQYTGEPVDGPLTLVVYPGADGSASLYEDDGHSFEYRRGEWMRVKMRWSDADRRLALALDDGSALLPTAQRRIEARVADETATRELVFDGQPVELRL